jgi:hypothetical protein
MQQPNTLSHCPSLRVMFAKPKHKGRQVLALKTILLSTQLRAYACLAKDQMLIDHCHSNQSDHFQAFKTINKSSRDVMISDDSPCATATSQSQQPPTPSLTSPLTSTL